MALDDILERIASDATAEAAAIVGDAERRAEETLAAARERSARDSERALDRARALAEAEAGQVRAIARLTARDAELVARNRLVEQALGEVERGLAALSADRYTAFVAERIADAARGGERVLVASADLERLAGLEKAVAEIAPGLSLQWGGEVDVDHGVVLVGERVRADLSVAATVAARRDELAALIAETLFGKGGNVPA